jgi:hypothetical protein
VVKDIEKLRSELKLGVVDYVEVLEKSHVPVNVVRTGKLALANVAVGSDWIETEGCGIQEIDTGSSCAACAGSFGSAQQYCAILIQTCSGIVYSGKNG